MANEQLISNVYFRGVSVGRGELTIMDTSVAPIYDIVYTAAGVTQTDLNNIIKNRDTQIQLKQNPLRPDVTKVYFKWSGPDANKLAVRVNGTLYKGETTGNADLDATGAITFKPEVDFYPSLTNLSATLEMYNDAEMKSLIRSIPIGSTAPTNPKLRLVAYRSRFGDVVEREPKGIWNNDQLYVEYIDDLLIAKTVVGDLTGGLYFNDELLPTGPIPSGGPTWVTAFNWDYNWTILSGGMRFQLTRQRNPVQRGNIPVKVTIGDLTATNECIDANIGALIQDPVWLNGSAEPTKLKQPFPTTINDSHANNLMVGYGFIKEKPVPYSNVLINAGNYNADEFVSNVTLYRDTMDSMSIRGDGYRVLEGGPTSAVSKGKLTYLAWDRAVMNLERNVVQFGKYQKTLYATYKWVLENGQAVTQWVRGEGTTARDRQTRTISLAAVNDPLATAKWGALTALNINTVACFVFTCRDSSVKGFEYNCSASVKMTGGEATLHQQWPLPAVGYLPELQPENENDREMQIAMLFLRPNGASEINTFDETVPYPRIINVQTNRPANANIGETTYWNFAIDPSLGIDLTDERYTFMTSINNDSSWGFEWYADQSVDLIGRTKHMLTFRYNQISSLDPSLSLAIVDTSPVSIPANRGAPMVKAVLWPVSGNVSGYIARLLAPTNGSSILNTRVYMSGYKFDLQYIAALNNAGTNPETPTVGEITMTYYTPETEITDAWYTKPETIYMYCSGETQPFTMRRNTSIANTGSSQNYFVEQGTPTSAAELLRFQRWLKSTLTTPKTVSFSIFK